jgi:hypothetical protein
MSVKNLVAIVDIPPAAATALSFLVTEWLT